MPRRRGNEQPPLEVLLERRCTKCRGRVQKVVSRSSFQLKGGGWYLTDYANKGGKKSESTESKSESKPAATACTPAGCGNCD